MFNKNHPNVTRAVQTHWPIVCGWVLVACAHTPAPTSQYASTEATVRAAQEAGANDDPQAQAYLKMSEDGLKKAETQMKSDQNEQAKRTLAESKADADLALELAKTKGSTK